MKIGLEVVVDVMPDGDVAGSIDQELIRVDLIAELRIVHAGRGVVVLEVDLHPDVMAVGRRQGLRQIRLAIVGRVDALDPGVDSQRQHRLQHGLLERRVAA